VSDFYEDDEDPAEVLAAFERGEQGVTGYWGWNLHLGGWYWPWRITRG
jgi:hypothetical protein